MIKNITLAIALVCAPVATYAMDYADMSSSSAKHSTSNCCCSQETQQSYRDMAKLFGGCRIAENEDEEKIVTMCSTTGLLCGLFCLTLPKATPALIATGVLSTSAGVYWGALCCISCGCGTKETTTLRTAPYSTAMTKSSSNEKLFAVEE